ncbi:PREDICTED: integrin alpha-8-like [Branchiostoma belcheri]|uniref:Integrin alpha-8-like n=1 Tax=Branchiostoma belcheri TaxID=7741 RepID=A0A6P5A021_BRABE|nr:PREDICTED: integrin alpha-8-like [Branchiostoma belcheri]
MATRRFSYSVGLLFALVTSLIEFGTGFNIDVDTRSAIVRRGPYGSYFGFSVDLHREGDKTWMLVGAPRAQTRQPGTDHPGAAYMCNLEHEPCVQIPFDTTGSDLIDGSLTLYKEDKSFQWFGASIKSSGPNGPVVACAPRYVYYTKYVREREPIGSCFVARRNFTSFREYTPCHSADEYDIAPWHRTGFCQAGFSVTFTSDGSKILIGAVGSYNWQGQVYSQSVRRSLMRRTSIGPAKENDTYLGYSTAVGEFDGDSLEDEYVVGVPRAKMMHGAVVILDATMRELATLAGEQMGAYFGYSVCVQDVNGDGADDVLVGAPMWTDREWPEDGWERGRVYIFHQLRAYGSRVRFNIAPTLIGEGAGERFGLSMVGLGDISKDGYNDVAISAPYGGKESAGVVYIYNGSPYGLKTEYSQKISGEAVVPGIRTFGFSLSASADIDGNQYRDLIVGAHATDTAVVLSFTITECFRYDGIAVPLNIELQYETVLDRIRASNSRADFLGRTDAIKLIRLTQGVRKCEQSQAYIRPDLRDKLTPIEVAVTHSLDDRPGAVLPPILDHHARHTVTDQTNILKDCGKDNICDTDLRITVSSERKDILIGTPYDFIMHVEVRNAGEGAYEAVMTMDVPDEVDYIGFHKKSKDAQVSCTNDFGVVKCELGNPMEANETIGIYLRLSVSRLSGMNDSVSFVVQANSSNVEDQTTSFDNEAILTLPVRAFANVGLRGVSIPEQVIVKMKTKQTEDQSDESGPVTVPPPPKPQFTHIYEILSTGPSTIGKSELKVYFPVKTVGGASFITLGNITVEGDGQCLVTRMLGLSEFNITSVQIGQLSATASPSDTEPPLQELRTRKRRQVSKAAVREQLDCTTSRCMLITCLFGPLKRNSIAIVRLTSFLHLDSHDVQRKVIERDVVSTGVFEVLEMPYHIQPVSMSTSLAQIVTPINPEKPTAAKRSVQTWVVVLAVMSGLLLLILLVLLLWKAGFFKRKYKQLMDYNGYLDADDDDDDDENGVVDFCKERWERLVSGIMSCWDWMDTRLTNLRDRYY